MRFRNLAVAAVAITAGAWLSAPAIEARDAGPFGALSGSWSGGGQLRFENGATERISCKAYYTPRDSGTTLGIALRCASPSNSIDLRSTLTSSSGRVSGSWEERTFNASGAITGRANDGNLTLAISGGGISGSMQVSTNGKSQHVSISTSGASLRGVTISLSRG